MEYPRFSRFEDAGEFPFGVLVETPYGEIKLMKCGKPAVQLATIKTGMLSDFCKALGLDDCSEQFYGEGSDREGNPPPGKELVTIFKEEYDSLEADSKLLTALQGAGVDNWDGYSEALKMVEEIE